MRVGEMRLTRVVRQARVHKIVAGNLQIDISEMPENCVLSVSNYRWFSGGHSFTSGGQWLGSASEGGRPVKTVQT